MRLLRVPAANPAAGLCLLIAACGGEKIVLPNDTVPAAIAVVSGNGQTGTVGALLADSVIVRVTDAGGRPVEDQPVTFSVTAGGGTVAPLTSNTNADGRAGVRWTLGATAGTQTGQAKVTGSGAPANLVAAFSATASSAGAAAVAAVSGNGQTGTAGSALADSLVVRVTDAGSNPVAGVSVAWSAAGGGTVSAPTVPTGADGRSAVKWTLGAAAGSQSVTASATGLVGSPIVFNGTAVVGAAGKLTITQQPSATAQSGVPFAQQPKIQLRDANGNVVSQPGIAVTAEVASGVGASLIGSATVATDANGLATFANLGLSAPAGSYTLSFTGTNLTGAASDPIVVGAGAAAALTLTVPPSSTASSGVPLTTQPVIQLVDGSGNPVAQAGRTVVAALVVQTGSATLSGTTSVATDGSGVATFTNLTLSGAAGSQVTLNFVSGLLSVPSGTTTIGAGTVSVTRSTLTVTGSPIIASSGASQATITVTARDASNNVITGAAVSVDVTGNNTVTQPVGGVTNGSGVATATVSSTEAGVKTATATINGTTINQQGTVTVNPGAVSASQSTVTAAPTSIQAVSGTSTITVTVRDAFDNPIPGATVVLTAPGASLTQPPGVTNTSGVAIGSLSSGTAGTRTVSASATKSPATAVSITETATVTVGLNGASVSVAGSPTSSVTGQTVTFTATVTGGSGTPTGTVQFQVDGSDAGSPVTLSGGSAQFSTQLDAGSRTITANYSGDGTYASGSGSLASYVVSKGATTVNISGDSPDPSVAGASYTVTFAVFASAPASGTPTGTVTVSDGTATCTGSAPSGSCALASPTSGSKTLTVTYDGNADFATSSQTTSHTVSPATASVTVSSSGNPSLAGEAVTFTATVSGAAGTPTGAVQFAFGGTPVGSPVALDAGGVATTTTTSLAVGPHSVTATYGGDATYAAGAVGTLAGGQVVNQGATTTAVTLSSGTDPSVAGSTVTFTATISVTAPASGSATGTVQFQDGGSDLGTPQSISAGAASLTTSALAAGTHSITAMYAGDAEFTGSTSPALSHTVTAANGAPSATADGYGTAEDAPLSVPAGTGVLANDSDPDSDPLTAVLDAGPANGALTLNADGSFSYTPDADFNGADQFSYHATDGIASSATVVVTLTISAVNDAPVFTAGADQTLTSPTGPQTVAGWATGIAAGPADEAGQALTFSITGNSNPAIFTTAPAVAADGTLTWEPSGVAGSSTITIELTDDGGTANGGVDTSPTQSFTITVN